MAGGIPEIVKHGETGILVERGRADPLAEAILQLLRDPGRCRQMGLLGAERVRQRFTWEASVEQLEGVLSRQ